MSNVILQNGTEIASDLRSNSNEGTTVPVKTTGDLLLRLKKNPPASFGILRTTCGLLGRYLDLPSDQIPFDTIEDKRKGFRGFLESDRYAENSVRSFVNQVRVLMKAARRFGWRPDDTVSDAWKPLLALAAEKEILQIVRHFSRATNTPGDVTAEDVHHWGESRLLEGALFTAVARKKNRFWRLLRDTGWTLNSPSLVKFDSYGIPLDQLAPELRREIDTALKWKQADFARNRPKKGQIRAVTATGLRRTICQLAGFVINVCGIKPDSLSDLVQQDLVERFIEWLVNERGKKGYSIQVALGMLAAVMCHHPAYASQDFSWLRTVIDSVPVEDDGARKERKAQKFIDYDTLESIPERIRTERERCERMRKKLVNRVPRLAMEELIVKWLLVLPWRQRNLRECRVGGSNPNLFKSKISPFSDLDKPAWVVEAEIRDPNAEFWQVRFSPKETKTAIAIHILLPRQLVGLLEQYLAQYRPLLLAGRGTETLFLNQAGAPLNAQEVEKIVGHWTLQLCGVRTTPHLFRDAIAFKWLKEHPKDFLTLAKMLWHKNVQTTIRIYGSRFNESSGVCAMEAWLDERERKAAKAA